MFILLRVVAYYVKCFNMLFLFNQGPYWKQVLFYALYMLSFNKTIPKKKNTGKFRKFLRSGKKLKFWITFGINHFYLSQNDMQYYNTLLRYINLTVMCAFFT